MAIAPASTPPKDIQDAVNAQKSYIGLQAQKRLETHKGQGPSAMSNKDLMASYQGYQASHPGSDLAEFAVATAPKLDLSAEQIKHMIASMPTGSASQPVTTSNSSLNQTLQSQGLEAQKRLEANKGSMEPNKSDLMDSYQGYTISHPGATLADFAKETAPKIGVTHYDIINAIDSMNYGARHVDK
ncbi:MAG: hypothetical protein EOO38_01100 [Cytophagaceae bacterium]|nr:MAG: hypothetical protein EOO38_01100 [Cytophagaceae bacterium]